MRAFNAKWLPLFNGLTYSALEDAAFCLPCVLFGNPSGAGASLVTTGFRDWKDAMSKALGAKTLQRGVLVTNDTKMPLQGLSALSHKSSHTPM